MSRITRRLTSLAVAAGTILALGATTAGATVTVNDNTPTDGQTLTATISSPPARATQYTLAECNITNATPLNWGLDCNGAAGSFTAPTPIATTRGRVTVNGTFDDVSFVPGGTPLFASTACRSSFGTDPCAVVVSYYDAIFTPLGAEAAPLTF
ncbi:hypothetical protein [Conexibacter sp. CPCC 206217]|uniref:hypothetical protein n=1 Tax=Conexibacter sp. CPCC 206217 TaxID=3064574 RepID=UPI00271AA625|nr:hypothetical protein [Conexibacter sp. CPCC 206217]MDO8213642.1 hypothetical protein [Conexibacter sp. CPCC 206217]